MLCSVCLVPTRLEATDSSLASSCLSTMTNLPLHELSVVVSPIYYLLAWDVHDKSWVVNKSHWSSTWRSVGVGIREVVLPGLAWVLGDGKNIRFWTDKWLYNEPLLESAVVSLPAGYEDVRVSDLWRNGTGWVLPEIMPYVSANTRLKLAAVVLDNVTGAKDRLSWGESLDGEFSVKSAYALLTRDTSPRQNVEKLFKSIWGVVAPERVKVFMWLVANQVIMTNAERFRRHLCATDLCQVCRSGEETILHVLRDCPAMAGIWSRITPQRRLPYFNEQPLLGWIYGNLRENTVVAGSPWSTLFAMVVWWGWKWRCGNVFGSNGHCRDRVKFVKDLAVEVTNAQALIGGNNNRPMRVEQQIGWVPPGDGWMKLNTDGASHGNPGLATAGGVLRDGDGNWRRGFAVNIGMCSAPMAELWGVYYGLYIAWESRVTRLELEVDSQIVVGFLTTGISDSHPLSFLVRLCYGFLSKDWIVRISHVYREANRLADGLANYAFSLPLGFHSFVSRPDFVHSVLLEDLSGSTRPRNVRL
ncbi:Ribonuclease H-like superfamily [Arabidopsis thaliana x Arabidopsis arenosa]|uniref:Ribonuclease H-like superfamily n=1 Tax=Arabidopsis thaliana x Arabidopsis arenosa TaxID=1240361 RepID=A0A8T1XMM4_9BRAS|nr:Ribonuclease H-like superfamily [Arabidopsis thaliana x Arabidopsis arenosa]